MCRRRTTTFYDAQCGLPLFEAPIGRTFFDWEDESTNHGWPSFREAELIADNVVIHSGGEMASTCGTHLGHNLPDSEDRYCIDLVCIAGQDWQLDNGTSPVVVDAGGSGWGAGDTALACFGISLLCCALAGGACAAPVRLAKQLTAAHTSAKGHHHLSPLGEGLGVASQAASARDHASPTAEEESKVQHAARGSQERVDTL